jgi:alpha-beta hydrolase superfamily lysophospholipase
MMNGKQTKAGNLGQFISRLLLILSGILLAVFIPWNAWALSSRPHPVQRYEEAVKRIEHLRADRVSEMNPDCTAQFMTHGQKVQDVIVLVHGYTNCPKEFVRLGEKLYRQGYNVLIAPLPHHGLTNRLNEEQGQLSAEELAKYTDQVVDIAQGLGDRVTILGYSCGGVVTAWAAQNRADVDTAVVISPAFGYLAIPTPLTAPVMNVVLATPDVFVWWEPELQAKSGFAYTYPRYSRHALAQIMRFGFSVQINARQRPPLAKRIFVVTNVNDDSVNNELTAQVTQSWRQHNAQLMTYEFPVTLKLPHDLIDANKSDSNVDVVDEKLIELIAR